MKSTLHRYWPLISLCVVFVAVFFTANSEYQYLIVTLTLLLAPFLDLNWKIPAYSFQRNQLFLWLVLAVMAAALIVLKPSLREFALLTLIFAAVPEEWFFRVYLMPRLGVGVKANILSSLVFTALHVVSHETAMALLVFLPSMFYGWFFQKTNDLIGVILLHALSNLVYVGLISAYFHW